MEDFDDKSRYMGPKGLIIIDEILCGEYSSNFSIKKKNL